jgi:hypothetical protein
MDTPAAARRGVNDAGDASALPFLELSHSTRVGYTGVARKIS